MVLLYFFFFFFFCQIYSVTVVGAYVKYDLEHILRLQTALNFQIEY